MLAKGSTATRRSRDSRAASSRPPAAPATWAFLMSSSSLWTSRAVCTRRSGAFFEATLHESIERRRKRRANLAHRRRGLAPDGHQQVEVRGPLERAPSSRHLIEDRPEREDVGSGIQRAAFRLFGRHIGARAEHLPRPRQRIDRGAIGRRRVQALQLRQPEVEDLQPSFVAHHRIGRLQVAMNDAVPMGGVDRVGQGDSHRQERGGGLRLALEPLQVRGIGGQPLRQDLQRAAAAAEPPTRRSRARAIRGSRGFMLFVSRLPAPRTVFIDRVRVKWRVRRSPAPAVRPRATRAGP